MARPTILDRAEYFALRLTKAYQQKDVPVSEHSIRKYFIHSYGSTDKYEYKGTTFYVRPKGIKFLIDGRLIANMSW